MTTQKLPVTSFLSPKSVTILVTILSIPFLSYYWLALARVIPDEVVRNSPNWITPLSIVLYLPFAFFAYILFVNLYIYTFTSVASITVAIAGLKWGHFNKFLRVWLVLMICAVVVFPFVYRYQPALIAAPGYKMQLVTHPGFFGGIAKASQNLTEQTPFEYELLGWSMDNQFYYQAVSGKETQVWQYSPDQSSHTLVSNTPPNLSLFAVSENTVLKMVRADGIKPETVEPGTRPILLKSKGIVSPDGRWTAIITQHIYGTQDIIILAEAN